MLRLCQSSAPLHPGSALHDIHSGEHTRWIILISTSDSVLVFLGFLCRHSVTITNRNVGTGAPGEIRTPDLLLRRQPLYPAELRAQTFV